ncbi:repetitive organellar protein-like [Channa argus]|uniref:repetitive organellar protein-like n=1 Tax=Channa argus TaxID=215402 RepID=UPI0035224E39
MARHCDGKATASELNIVVFGGTDKDRTVLGNFITRQKSFSCPILIPDKQCAHAHGQWIEKSLTVVKTPDVFDLPFLAVTKEIGKCLNLCTPGPVVMLLVVRTSDFTEDKRQAAKAIFSLFGEDAFKNSMVIITQNETEENASVDNIIQDCNQRQHRLKLDKSNLNNNKLTELMNKIENMLRVSDDFSSGANRHHSNSPCNQGPADDIFSNAKRKYADLISLLKILLENHLKAHAWYDRQTEIKTLEEPREAVQSQLSCKKLNTQDKNLKYEETEKGDKICREQGAKLQTQSEEQYKKKLEDCRKKMERMKEEYEDKIRDITNTNKTFAKLVVKYINEKNELAEQHERNQKDLMRDHERHIAHLKQEHTDEIRDFNQTYDEKMRDREIEYEKRTQEEKEKITSLKQSHIKDINDLKQVHENKLTALKLDSDREIHHLKCEHDIATKGLKVEHENKLQSLTQQHEEKMKAIKQEYDSDLWQNRLMEIVKTILLIQGNGINFGPDWIKKPAQKSQDDDQITNLKQECDEKLRNREREHEEKIKNLKQNNTKEKMDLKEEYDQKITNLKKDHTRKMDVQKQEYENAITDLKREHNKKIKDLMKGNEDNIKDLKQEQINEINSLKQEQNNNVADLKKDNEYKLQDLTQRQEDKIKHLQQNHLEEIENLKRDHANKITDLKQECGAKLRDLKQEYDNKIKDLKLEHNENTTAQKQDCDRRMKDLKVEQSIKLQDVTQEHENKIMRLNQEHDETVKDMKQKHTEQISDLKQEGVLQWNIIFVCLLLQILTHISMYLI